MEGSVFKIKYHTDQFFGQVDGDYQELVTLNDNNFNNQHQQFNCQNEEEQLSEEDIQSIIQFDGQGMLTDNQKQLNTINQDQLGSNISTGDGLYSHSFETSDSQQMDKSEYQTNNQNIKIITNSSNESEQQRNNNINSSANSNNNKKSNNKKQSSQRTKKVRFQKRVFDIFWTHFINYKPAEKLIIRNISKKKKWKQKYFKKIFLFFNQKIRYFNKN
ncbi:hypothetical protein ABPG72_010650 [Tetrahymena utriculariae]